MCSIAVLLISAQLASNALGFKNKVVPTLIASISVRTLILFLLIHIIRRYRLFRIYSSPAHSEFKVITLSFLTLSVILSIYCFTVDAPLLASLFILKMILVAFIEEFTFRGIVFPLIAREKRSVIKGGLYSAILFGMMHYINFLSNPNLAALNGLFLYATCGGILFAGIFAYTRILYLCVMLHFCINVMVGVHTIHRTTPSVADKVDILHQIPGLLLHVAVVFLGYYLLLKSEKIQILKSLESIKL